MCPQASLTSPDASCTPSTGRRRPSSTHHSLSHGPMQYAHMPPRPLWACPALSACTRLLRMCPRPIFHVPHPIDASHAPLTRRRLPRTRPPLPAPSRNAHRCPMTLTATCIHQDSPPRPFWMYPAPPDLFGRIPVPPSRPTATRRTPNDAPRPVPCPATLSDTPRPPMAPQADAQTHPGPFARTPVSSMRCHHYRCVLHVPHMLQPQLRPHACELTTPDVPRPSRRAAAALDAFQRVLTCTTTHRHVPPPPQKHPDPVRQATAHTRRVSPLSDVSQTGHSDPGPFSILLAH